MVNHQKEFLKKIKDYEKDPEYICEGLILAIGERICKELNKHTISYDEFAGQCGKPSRWIHNILKGRPNMTLKELSEIAAKLELSFKSDIFK